MARDRFVDAVDVMRRFAAATGLNPSDEKLAKTRYLWTDAWSIINFIGLSSEALARKEYTLALDLIDLAKLTAAKTQEVLGFHRRAQFDDDKDTRTGPLQNGGMRIGKPYPENYSSQSDPLSYDRDGQYFHYLTKWMNALCMLANITTESKYAADALKVAKEVFPRFYTRHGNGSGMLYWKMSIDLTRPAVTSMGRHDALDGLITYLQVQSTGKDLNFLLDKDTGLGSEIECFEEILKQDIHSRPSADHLEAGGLLIDAIHLAAMIQCHNLKQSDRLFDILTEAAATVEECSQRIAHDLSSDHMRDRIPFREFGLSTGLQGMGALRSVLNAEQLKKAVSKIETIEASQKKLLEAISQWEEPHTHQYASWTEHQEITDVMYASHLWPNGFFFY